MLLQQILQDEGFSESDLDFSFEDEDDLGMSQTQLEDLGSAFLNDPEMEKAMRMALDDDNDSFFGDNASGVSAPAIPIIVTECLDTSSELLDKPTNMENRRGSMPASLTKLQRKPRSESFNAATLDSSKASTPEIKVEAEEEELDDFERFKRSLEMGSHETTSQPSPPIPRLAPDITTAEDEAASPKKMTTMQRKCNAKKGGKPPSGMPGSGLAAPVGRSKSARLSREAGDSAREKYKNCKNARTPESRKRVVSNSTAPKQPSEFDRADFIQRSKFNETKEFRMMEMLRKAELMVQKKKRQMMNRQIAELKQELANLPTTLQSMSLDDYNQLREKLRLLPKDVRENSKGKALIAQIEQEAYLSRKRIACEDEEEQKRSFRKAELSALRSKRRKESAMIKQVMETGQVAPQNTLKRTREAVSRWLVANDDEEDSGEGQSGSDLSRSSSMSMRSTMDNAIVDRELMNQYEAFRAQLRIANEGIDPEAVQSIMLNSFVDYKEWLYGNAKYPVQLDDADGLLDYFSSAKSVLDYNEYRAFVKETRRQRAKHRRKPGAGVGRSQSLRRSYNGTNNAAGLKKSGSTHSLKVHSGGLKKSGSTHSMKDALAAGGLSRSDSLASGASGGSGLSRSSSFHRLAGRRDSTTYLVAEPDSAGQSVPAGAYDEAASGNQVWLQMLASKLEKVNQEKSEKTQKLGNIIDKVVRAIVSRCTCKTPFQLDRVGDGKYKLPQTSQLFFVRILRNHVMVRVGGGWDTLDHFIAKHDPCRMKFKQITGGAFSPSNSISPVNSPVRSPSGHGFGPRKGINSPMKGRRIHKSASGCSLSSGGSLSSSPVPSHKDIENARSKLPKPGAGKGSKLPTPKTPKTQPKNIGRKV